MNIPEKCREKYLSGVTDAFFYPREGSSLPMPFSVGQILSMQNCKFPKATLHVAMTGEEYVMSDGITAKVTPNIAQNGTNYSFDISANITDGGENVREAYKKMRGKDFFVVLRKFDGTFALCYSLPGTFVLKYTVSVTADDEQRTLSVSLKSMSDFIPITIV
jgi:hypothetical protein